MPTAILQTAELARTRFVKGEIEAGIVFADNAIEYWDSNPSRALSFRADAQDCYETASLLIQQAGPSHRWPQELGAMMDDLKGRLDVLRRTQLIASVAA